MPDMTGHADFETISNFKGSFRPVHRYRAPMSVTSAGVAESPGVGLPGDSPSILQWQDLLT